MSDSRKIMCDELVQIHGRHRQFFKVQFTKVMLDKFEPSKEVKDPNDNQKKNKQKDKEGKKVDKQEKVEKEQWSQIKNFCMTMLLYEDESH